MSVLSRLSIITPAWNSAPTFPDTLAAISRLVQAGAEHIVVDSGSDDGTVELAEASGARVLYCPPGNMYAAINIGLEAAGGDWITYINSDDLLYADAVEEMLQSAEPEDDLLYGNLDYVDEVNRFLFYWRSAGERGLLCNFACYCAVFQQGVLFRRRVLEALKGFDTDYRFCADYDFLFRAAQQGFRYRKYREKSVGAFRLLSSQLSQSRKEEMCKEGPRIRARYWEGKPRLARRAAQLYSFLYRNGINLDSRLLRKLHARCLDRREY